MKKLIIIVTVSVFSTWGCTGDFDKMNTDPNSLNQGNISQREVPYMFAKAQSAAALNRSYYQTVQNLYADQYAQYLACTINTFTTDRYVMNDGWLQRFYIVVYTDTAPQLKFIMDYMPANSGEAALANIVWVYAFQWLTDHFGPIPYTGILEERENYPYDSMEQIYDDFFTRLRQAVATLEALPAGTRVLEGYELMYDGDVANWIRFANTLRLRLAMRISGVEPIKARTEAEAAVAAGVLTDNTQNAFLLKSAAGNDTNGLSQIAEWNQCAMSSTIASYMKGYADPRMEVYFQAPLNGGDISSLRNGHSANDLNNPRNQPDVNSNVGTYWVTQTTSRTFAGVLTAPFHVMCCAEAYFLRAEGALNGWNMGGNAQALYEEGIDVSMQQWGIDDPAVIGAYIASSAAPDPPGDYANSPAVATIPVAWGADVATQRQQIGTQKWLAIFPNGMEAWAEFRRTGYPTMYPVVQSDNADLTNTFIKRLPYPSVEETNNEAGLASGRALLGGADNTATRLWWDTTP